jgi:hypothetical protein
MASKAELEEHWMKNHSVLSPLREGDLMFVCKICGKGCRTERGLHTHAGHMHAGARSESELGRGSRQNLREEQEAEEAIADKTESKGLANIKVQHQVEPWALIGSVIKTLTDRGAEVTVTMTVRVMK